MSKLLVDEISDADNTGPVTVTDGLTVQGAFTSLGIDDNATSTAMTIDSSGNVLVGKAAIGLSTTGIDLRSIGLIQAIRNGGTVVELNRQTSDGTIIDFRKDNSTVGSIGYIASGLYIDGEGGHAGLRFGGADITPRDGGADADAAIQLGQSGARFTDLYLSGGVYLGGTGSANKLDDYEEGTWTPTYTSSSTDPTFSPDLQNGVYTKIGRMVYASFRLRGAISGTKTGNLRLSGLPFTANSSPANGSGSIGLTEVFGADNYPTNLRVNQSATYINLMVYDNADPRDGLFTNVTVTSTSGASDGNYIIGHVVYQTD